MDMNLEKDVAGFPIIGQGQCAQIYKISESRVAKLFFASVPETSIIKEYEQTKKCHELGVDAVACYEMFTCKGRIGFEMELLQGTTLHQELLDHPQQLEEYGKKFAEQLQLINSTEVAEQAFPSAKSFYLDCIEKCCADSWISQEESAKLRAFVEAIPECSTMLHGDYHVHNLMVVQGKIRLIDMSDCMLGHPIFDLALAYLYMDYIPKKLPELFGALFKLTPEQAIAFWQTFMETYFPEAKSEQMAELQEILKVYAMLKLMLCPYSFSNLPKEALPGFVARGREELMGCIEEYTGILERRGSEYGL